MKSLSKIQSSFIVILMVLLVFVLLKGHDSDYHQPDLTAGLLVEQQLASEWTKIGQKDLRVDYTTSSIPVTLTGDRSLFRITHRGGDFSDVDSIRLQACSESLSPKRASYVSSNEDVTALVRESDLTVAILQDKIIEVEFEHDASCENAVLSIVANAYSHAAPFHLKQINGEPLSYQLDSVKRTHNVDGKLLEVDGRLNPQFVDFWEPATGHPDGYTYIYVGNDEERLYVSLDVTMDNTDEDGDDWVKLLIGDKTYSITDEDSSYGACFFGRTSKASYLHETCEFSIPLEDLMSDEVIFELKYYGTGGAPVVNGPPIMPQDFSDEYYAVRMFDTTIDEGWFREFGTGTPGTRTIFFSGIFTDPDHHVMDVIELSVGGYVVAYGLDESTNGSGYDLRIARITSPGSASTWDVPLALRGQDAGDNGVSKLVQMIPDLSGGLFALYLSGDITPASETGNVILDHIDSAGTVTNLETFGWYNADMIPDGSGGVFVLYDIGAPRLPGDMNAHGSVRHYTSAGMDVGFGTVAVSTNTTSLKSGAVMIPTDDITGGDILVFWGDDAAGELGIYGQKISSAGALLWDARGEQLVDTVAEGSGFNSLEFLRASSGFAFDSVYVAYKDSGDDWRVFEVDDSGPTLNWGCIQNFGPGSAIGIAHEQGISGGTRGVVVVGEDGTELRAQLYAQSDGSSVWDGEQIIVDASNTEAALQNPFYPSDDENVRINANSIEPDGGNGFDFIYSSGGTPDVFNLSFDRFTFASGPGGDCLAPSVFTWTDHTVVSGGGITPRASDHVNINALTAYIVYHDDTGEDLRFAKTTDGGDNFTDIIIDDGGGTANVGLYNAIYAVDASNIFVAYTDSTNQDLKFAFSSNAGDTWTIVTAQSGVDPGELDVHASSLSNPVVAYSDNNSGQMSFTESNNGGTTWEPVVQIEGGTGAEGVAIHALDASNIYVSYYDGVFPRFVFAESSNGGSSFTLNLVYNPGVDINSFSDMSVVDASNIFMAVHDTSDDNLNFTSSSNGGSTWSAPSDIESNFAGPGEFPSIVALDTSEVFISYIQDGGDVKFAESFDGFSSFTLSFIDDTTNAQDSTSLQAISSSLMTVVHNDTSNDSLIYAEGSAAAPNSAPTAPTALFAGNTEAQTGSTNPTGITNPSPFFSAICEDLDAGDILNAYQLVVATDAAMTNVIFDSGGAPGTAMPNCTAGSRSSDIQFGGAPLAQDGTEYFWRIKFFDDDAAEGVFSEAPPVTNSFTMATQDIRTTHGGGGSSTVSGCSETGFINIPVQFGSTYSFNYYPDQPCGPEMGRCPSGVSMGDCPSGFVVTGIKYYEQQGDLIDGVGTRCTQLYPDGTLGDHIYNNYYPNTPCNGEMGRCPSGVSLGDCPGGSVVTGVKYYSNPDPDSDYTEGAGFVCQTLSGGITQPISLTGRQANHFYPDNPCDGEMGACPDLIGGGECPPGYAVTGVKYYEYSNTGNSDNVDGLGFTCTKLTGGGTQSTNLCATDPAQDLQPAAEEPEDNFCGNAIVDDGEECDDGNLIDGDGCSSECLLEELLPQPEIVILDLIQPTRDHGLIIDYKVLGLSSGVLHVDAEPKHTQTPGSLERLDDLEPVDSGTVDIELQELELRGVEPIQIGSSDYLPNVPMRIEIPKSDIRPILSFDYSRVFYDIGKGREMSPKDYQSLFIQAEVESQFPLILKAKSPDGEAETDAQLLLDNFPPAVQIDTPAGLYDGPLNIEIFVE